MKISKQRANEAAIKICEPLMLKINQHDKKINEDVAEIIKARVPNEVLELFQKHPLYFRTTSSQYLGASGGKSVYARFGFAVPEKNNDRSLSAKEMAIVTPLLNTKETLQEQYNKAVADIENTILALGTEKRVQDEFPEAYPYLNVSAASSNTGLMLNVAPVRKLACSLIPNCGKNK